MNNHEKRQPKEDKGDEPINNTFIYTTPVEQRTGTSSTPDEERYEASCKRKSKPHRVDLVQTVDEAGNDAYCEEIKQGEKTAPTISDSCRSSVATKTMMSFSRTPTTQV
jgi:hypothetical protein